LYSGPRHGWQDAPPQCPKCMEKAVEILKKEKKQQ